MGKVAAPCSCTSGALAVKLLVSSPFALSSARVRAPTDSCSVPDTGNAVPQHPKSQIPNPAQGHEAAVLLLLEAGADVSAKDGDGDTPLGCAANCAAVVGARLPADASEVGGGRGGCHAAVAVLLIENGAELSGENNEGRTPLHIAAYFGNEVLAKVLLEHGADVSARYNP